MSNRIGNRIQLQIFGQSHSPAIGAVIDGFPAGIAPDMAFIERFMARRAPGQGAHTTARREADRPQIVSGLNEKGLTCGAPIAAIIANTDARPGDYDELRDVPRPGHADYAAYLKYRGHNDVRGGGQFSGRLTAPMCFAGALCLQLLAEKGIRVKARILSIAGVDDAAMDAAAPDLDAIADEAFACVDAVQARRMAAEVDAARGAGDSVGGVIECFATGLPAGLGEPMFGGVENRLSQALFGIPAVRGVAFGEGFAAAAMRGSEHNDAYLPDPIRTATNRHGGVLGGITTGMPLVVRVAIKPTSSIAQEQESVSLRSGEAAKLSVRGRHDPCIVPRAVPCVEAAVALVVADILLERNI